MAWKRTGSEAPRGEMDQRPRSREGGETSSDLTQRRLDDIRTGVVLHREREIRAQALDAYRRLDEASERLIAAIVRVVQARAAWTERYEAARSLAERHQEVAGPARVEAMPAPPTAPWPTREEHPTIWTLLQPDAVLETPNPDRLKEEFNSWAGRWSGMAESVGPEARGQGRGAVDAAPDEVVVTHSNAESGSEEPDRNWLGGEVRPSPESVDEALPLRSRRLSSDDDDNPWGFPPEREQPMPEEAEDARERAPVSEVLQAFEYSPSQEDEPDVVPPVVLPEDLSRVVDDEPDADGTRAEAAASPVRTRTLHVAGIGSFSWGDAVKSAPSRAASSVPGPPETPEPPLEPNAEPAPSGAQGLSEPVPDPEPDLEPMDTAVSWPEADASTSDPYPEANQEAPPPEPIPFVRPREDRVLDEEDAEAAIEPVFVADDEAFEA